MLQDILAAIGMILNGITSSILAITYGFSLGPGAIAYGIGIVGCLAYNSVLPISLQSETILLAGTMGKSVRERLSMVMFAGLAMAALGATGLLQVIIDFAGSNIVNAMMVGVGIILTRVSIDILRENPLIGAISLVSGILFYVFTKDLIYVVVGSVFISTLVSYFKFGKLETPDGEKGLKFKFHKPVVNFNVIRGTLALMCLTVGANIAFGGITAGMSGVPGDVDALTVYSGLADAASALFGGPPVEAVISPTAAAPHAMFSGILMMGLMAILLATGLMHKIMKLVPAASITGFLFVLGAIVTVPSNAFAALNGASNVGTLSAGVTMVVTSITDPFTGMVAGIIMKLIAGPMGL